MWRHHSNPGRRPRVASQGLCTSMLHALVSTLPSGSGRAPRSLSQAGAAPCGPRQEAALPETKEKRGTPAAAAASITLMLVSPQICAAPGRMHAIWARAARGRGACASGTKQGPSSAVRSVSVGRHEPQGRCRRAVGTRLRMFKARAAKQVLEDLGGPSDSIAGHSGAAPPPCTCSRCCQRLPWWTPPPPPP